MTICKLWIHELLFSLDLQQHKQPCLWLWDSTQRFQIIINNDLDAATIFYLRLIVDLAPIDSCIVRRYKTSKISQRVTYKSSKSLQNIVRVSLLYVKKLEWNHKHFRGPGLDLKNLQNSVPMIFDQSSLTEIFFLFCNQLNLKLETNTFKHSLIPRLDIFYSWFANTIKTWF